MSDHTGRFNVQGKRALVTGANLEGANLEDTKLEDANCQGASYNDRTIWPTGFNYKESGTTRSSI